MKVNYSASGAHSTFYDGTPTHITEVDLQFKELNPIYQEDYDSAGRSWILMSYFRELPIINYQSPFSDRSSSDDYVVVKNLFRRVKLRDDLKSNITFLKIIILEMDLDLIKLLDDIIWFIQHMIGLLFILVV